MTAKPLEQCDHGRITVDARYADALRDNGLGTFQAVMEFDGGEVAKNLLKERTTTRVELQRGDGSIDVMYLKRHARPPIKEYIKPWLRLTRPILGARNEWQAILRFDEAGLATTPAVAWGRDQGQSFLLTEAIENCHSLADYARSQLPQLSERQRWSEMCRFARLLGRVTRRMHQSGLHHQDYYLYHLLVPVQQPSSEIYIIDLGRARQVRNLRRQSRWVVKDLGQLMFAAGFASRAMRFRFLTEYLGRRPGASDAGWLRRIERKAAQIARHTRKNDL